MMNSYYKNKIIKDDSTILFNDDNARCIIYKDFDFKSITFTLDKSTYGHRMQFTGNRLINYYFIVKNNTSTYEIFYHPKKGIMSIYGSPLVDISINHDNSRKLLFSQVEYDSLVVFNSDSNKKIELNESNKLPYVKESTIYLNEDFIPLKIECYNFGRLVRTFMDTIDANVNKLIIPSHH